MLYTPGSMSNPLNPALLVLSALIFLAGGLLLLQVIDGTPPRAGIVVGEELVQADADLGRVRGKGVWTVKVRDKRPGVHAARVSIDGGEPILMRTPTKLVIDTSALQEGEHTFVLEVVDRSIRRNATRIAGRFVADNTPPELLLSNASLSVQQGRTLAMHVRTNEPVDAFRGAMLKKERTFHAMDDGGRAFRALIGVPVEAEVGRTVMELRARDLAGNVRRVFLAVTIEDGKFARGGMIRLTAAQTKARTEKERIAAANQRRGDAYATDLVPQQWEDVFERPVRGRRTSPFGKYRTYSDGKKKHHYGVDIAARTGTPVGATAAGEVVLAEEQPIYGNVVIVHHGQGVSSSYNHLHTIDVTVGQQVAAGARVGTVGSTGQSTGPHLHWGMVVDGAAVDAEQWEGRDMAMPGREAGWTPVSQIELKRKSS